MSLTDSQSRFHSWLTFWIDTFDEFIKHLFVWMWISSFIHLDWHLACPSSTSCSADNGLVCVFCTHQVQLLIFISLDNCSLRETFYKYIAFCDINLWTHFDLSALSVFRLIKTEDSGFWEEGLGFIAFRVLEINLQ